MLPLKKALLALTIACLTCAPINAIKPSPVAQGPILASIFYWLTKGVGYGVPVVIGTQVAATTVTAAAGLNAGIATNVALSAGQTAAVNSALAGTVYGFELTAAQATAMAASAGLPGATVATAMTAAPVVAASTAAPAVATTAAKVAIGIGLSPQGAAMTGVAVGKTVIAKVGLDAAALGTTAMITASNGAAGYAAGVETAATFAAYLGSLIPWF